MKVIVKLFKKSANILPIIGTSKYAFTDGTYFSVSACIFAIALGVAPIPKPQVPAASTAAIDTRSEEHTSELQSPS